MVLGTKQLKDHFGTKEKNRLVIFHAGAWEVILLCKMTQA